jgi:type II secretory pathway component PulC
MRTPASFPWTNPTFFPSSLLVALTMLAVSACGGAEAQTGPSRTLANAQKAPKLAVKRGVVLRSEVKSALSLSLGSFLRHVDVEAAFKDGAFVGYQIKALRDASDWDGFDLRIGDVVSRVNGMPIERAEQAMLAFYACARVKEISVTGERAGAPLAVTVPIVED